MIDEFSRDHLEMFEKIVFFMESRNQYQEAIYIAQALLDRHSENGKIFLFSHGNFEIFISGKPVQMAKMV